MASVATRARPAWKANDIQSCCAFQTSTGVNISARLTSTAR